MIAAIYARRSTEQEFGSESYFIRGHPKGVSRSSEISL